jgi:LacI family transcriptional regulator
VARRHDFTAFFLSTDDDGGTARHAIETLCERRVDGIIYASARSGDPCLRLLDQAGVPAVLMNRVDLRDPQRSRRDFVVVDNARGAFIGVEHLVGLGHRRIGVIAGRRDLSTGVGRLAGVRRALRHFGIAADPHLVVTGEFRRDASYAACQRLLKLARRPTAIFALNDDMAVGAYEAIVQAGLRVPEDVALLGFGNSDLTSIAGVEISTIDLRKYEIGRASVEILVDRIEGRAPKGPRQVVLEPRLVVRRSTVGPGEGR